MYVISAFFIIVGLFYLFNSGLIPLITKEKCTEEVIATRTHIDEEMVRQRGSQNYTRYYRATLSYEVNGQIYLKKSGLRTRQPQKLGTLVPIRVNPNKPESIYEYEDVPLHAVGACLASVLIIAGGFLLLLFTVFMNSLT